MTGISLFIFFCFVTAILMVGLLFYQNKNNPSGIEMALTPQNKTADLAKLVSSGATVLDFAEVAKHNTVSDCWMIISGKVYDVSNYAGAHPGGAQNIASSCGTDATQAYDTKGGRGDRIPGMPIKCSHNFTLET